MLSNNIRENLAFTVSSYYNFLPPVTDGSHWGVKTPGAH